MHRYLSFLTLAGLIVSLTAFAAESPIQYAFSGATAEENKVTLQGAGFGAYPQANVEFGYIPTDNAFDGATDGQGAIITAQPGEGAMIFGANVESSYAAMIRCSVRTDQAHAAVTLATIGDKPDQFVATNSPANEAFFTGQYQRISVFYTPPSNGFLPVIQIVNTSATEALTAYVDNFEVYTLDPRKYYSAAFLDGDAVDPPVDQISVPSESEAAFMGGDSKDVKIKGENVTFRYCAPGTVHHGGDDIAVASFWMQESEVTQKLWKAVMGSLPSEIPSEWIKDDYPVFCVSYDDCNAFLTKINEVKIDGVKIVRIPSVVEWEHACRAGTTTRFYWGDDILVNVDEHLKEGGDYAWYIYNSDKRPHKVKDKKENKWHLHDMSGNIEEWTSSSSWFSGELCYITCGGSYFSNGLACQSSQNWGYISGSWKDKETGFRLALDME